METITIDVLYYEDEAGKKVYDFEGMADVFEQQLSKLDDDVVVMCSVQTK